ncbi:hypothetical protein M9H77_19770 [Catharanthus roseus]|uniref:Uncharacterized protein n=1 Tax=Catharanthus roseus TaxID=4058 RepID=A0ACC0BBA1_CATRO|nr:hypothetical protein M9H77_19770 [Catharanthus roseus]
MARLLVLLAVCLLPALASALFSGKYFLLRGKVYCDTCRVGYETTATKYLPGSHVDLICRKRDQPEAITYKVSGVTDSTGEYKIPVGRDCGDDICDVVLVKSSDPECATPNSGRDRARVALTWNNGMVSSTRFANNLGFLLNVPLASCPQVLQQYQDTEGSY